MKKETSMTTLTFGEVVRGFFDSTVQVVNVSDDPAFIRKCIDSKASCCWVCGEEIAGGGWVVISTPSAASRESKRPVFIANKAAYESVKGEPA